MIKSKTAVVHYKQTVNKASKLILKY